MTWRKSSYSGTGNCVEVGWHTSSYSGGSGCVDVWIQRTQVWVRNSKDPAATTVVFTHTEWAAFLAGVRAGEFDNPDNEEGNHG